MLLRNIQGTVSVAFLLHVNMDLQTEILLIGGPDAGRNSLGIAELINHLASL